MVTSSLFEEYFLQEDSAIRKEELYLSYLQKLEAWDPDVRAEGNPPDLAADWPLIISVTKFVKPVWSSKGFPNTPTYWGRQDILFL